MTHFHRTCPQSSGYSTCFHGQDGEVCRWKARLAVLTLPSFSPLCISLWPNMVSEREEGKKEGSQERKDGRAVRVSVFCSLWTFFCSCRKSFPLFTESSGSYIASAPLQMDSADLRKDAVYITAIFVSTSTVGSTVGKGNRPHNMWKPFVGRGGAPLAFLGPFGFNTNEHRFVPWSVTPPN